MKFGTAQWNLLANSLIYPTLYYASVIWHPYANTRNINKSARVQNKNPGFIFNQHGRNTSVTSLIRKGILSLETNLLIDRLKIHYQTINNHAYIDRNQYVTFLPIWAIGYHSSQLITFQTRNDCFKHSSLFPWTIVEWNSPPSHIVSWWICKSSLWSIYTCLRYVYSLAGRPIFCAFVSSIHCTVLKCFTCL